MQSEQQCILIHYGELGLKGKNQPAFRRRLRENIRKRLDIAGLDWPIEETKCYFTILVPQDSKESLSTALQALRQVFGIAWLAPALRIPHRNFTGEAQSEDFARLYEHLSSMANSLYAPGKTFRVRVKRPNKFVPFTSPELAARVGEWIIDHTEWKKVELWEPDVTFHLELHKSTVCLFSERLSGPGGLPVGSAGRVLALLSGGIDSPVAAYMMAKRGCQVDFIHFTASFADAEQLKKQKVWRLIQLLNQYTLGSRLFVVPYTYFDMALMNGKIDYEVILFRRFMLRVAGQLARKTKALALVTGDNLSQVASQTLSNLATTAKVAELPLLQPVIGFDKEEIIALAKRIGTMEESVQPYKDCCALISQNPRTNSDERVLQELEAQLPNYPSIVEKTLADMVCLQPE